MSEVLIYSIAKKAITTTTLVSAPILLVAMIVGLAISIFQAVTQIQEQTLTFVPKMVAIIFVMILLGPWMTKTLVQFIENMINTIPSIVG
ncbi:flagellar biosynthesis protein FliQ [Clostridium cylindrosporum]|uniref:Flagellar biosynthetic protein FliQ n=1 Tax=Clostridium cylindrosporum DSM 605 TaxID=1121307 RepID=A0A0J8D746_CLOCY|nr:flagellar biosynthesis protein FliQ [Clostridium cylindrosporum]KMT21712.1 flagellar biosynthetic protein FliQ [Clostridium cylindrosporum DSM 605]